MQDSLIGYLMGALDESEIAKLEAELDRNPALQDQLKLAAASLQVLKSDADDIEPPAGLASATCQFVHDCRQSVHVRDRRSVAARRTATAFPDQSAHNDQWTLIDVVIAASVLLAACMLAFPAINNSRYHAGIVGCQNNLRSIGRALIEYSNQDPLGMFPSIPAAGNLSVSGMYAPTLMEQGLVQEDHNFYCPAQTKFDVIVPIPKMAQIKQACGPKLVRLQQTMGGDYGFSLGVFGKKGDVRGVQNQGRTHFAVMSDSPKYLDCQKVPKDQQLRHRNVLFEGGCVKAISKASVCWRGDELYQNDDGVVAAGVHESDAVIGASDTAPVVRFRARLVSSR